MFGTQSSFVEILEKVRSSKRPASSSLSNSSSSDGTPCETGTAGAELLRRADDAAAQGAPARARALRLRAARAYSKGHAAADARAAARLADDAAMGDGGAGM